MQEQLARMVHCSKPLCLYNGYFHDIELQLVNEISQRPEEAATLCYLYSNYMVQVTELQVDSFLKVGSVALSAAFMD